MRRIPLVAPVAFAAALAVAMTGATPAANATADSAWPAAVSRICSNALLFEHRHEIGTRAGALAVARDIRASTESRLARVESLTVVPRSPSLARSWLNVERRLAALYARTYVRIFDVIASADTAAERAREPATLRRLVHAPDRLQRKAARLELRLQILDCTGGSVGLR